MPHLDYWFDFSSPFAYLGSTQIEAVATKAGATLAWRPMFLGGLFKAINTPQVPLLQQSAQKQQYYAKDLLRHASWYGVPFSWPSRFPVMTVRPLRLVHLLSDPGPYIHRVFAAYWAEDKDIGDAAVLADLCREVDIDPALIERTNEQAVKEQLTSSTDEAVKLGVFGAPTSVVDGQIFWGQDRLHFVEKALSGWNPLPR